MKVSTATSILVNYPLKSAIDKVISIGFDGVDMWCGRPHLFRRDYSEESVSALGSTIREKGLRVVSVMPAFYRYPFSLSSPIEPIRLDSIGYMKDCIDNAVLIGADNVLVVPISRLFDQDPAEARSVFIKSLAEVAVYAEQKRIKLALEVLNPQISNFMAKAQHAADIIKELKSDNFGIVLDSGHVNLSEESFEAALDIACDRLVNIHINDNDGIEQTNSIPGEFSFDFYALKETLKKYNYDGYLSLELGYHYSFDPVNTLSKAISVTKDIFDIN